MKKILLYLFSAVLLLFVFNSNATEAPANSTGKTRSNAPRNAHHVVGGNGFTVEIRSGEIWAWGLNNHGQLGDGTHTNSNTPVQEATHANDWVDINCGGNHVIAIKADGTVWAWGFNDKGQLGINVNPDTSVPLQIGTENNWVSMGCGVNQTYVIKADGTLWACGSNQNGALGLGTSVPTFPTLTMVGNNHNWRNISGGNNHVAAIQYDGTLWTWGTNDVGQLGVGTLTVLQNLAPVQIGSATSWISVETGDNSVLGLQNNGKLFAWGFNGAGQLGDGTSQNQNAPVQIGATIKWIGMSIGQTGNSNLTHSLGVSSDGKLFAWGSNVFGQLGIGTPDSNPHPTPLLISSMTNLVNVECGFGTSYSIAANGALFSWGNNSTGQIGNGNTNNEASPVQASVVPLGWSKVAAGDTYTAALKSDGNIWTMGNNDFGQLGNGSTTPNSLVPVQVIGSDFKQVVCGKSHTLAIKANGTLWAWGKNVNGQLGIGNSDASLHSTPIQIGVGNNWTSVSAGDAYSMAIKADGTLWAWGDNTFGQFGNGTPNPTPTTAPIQISGLDTWVDVECGTDFTLILKSNGTLSAAGNNDFGQLGIGSLASIVPSFQLVTAVPTNNWISIAASAGGAHSLGVTSNGLVYAWGDNTHGQIGDGTFNPHNAPVVVSFFQTLGVKALTVYAGLAHSFAIINTGEIYGWGDNASSQLGHSVTHTLPFLVDSVSNIVTMACGYNHTAIIHSDRSLLCMSGLNNFGQLGNGTTTDSHQFDFVVNALPCNNPSIPILIASSTSLCGNGTVVLSVVSGSMLNSATHWQWYSGSCGGTPIGTGTIITASPAATTTFFARGEGGCPALGACANITIGVMFPVDWYLDADNDGFGNATVIQSSCTQPIGFVADPTDCDDSNPAIHLLPTGALTVNISGITPTSAFVDATPITPGAQYLVSVNGLTFTGPFSFPYQLSGLVAGTTYNISVKFAPNLCNTGVYSTTFTTPLCTGAPAAPVISGPSALCGLAAANYSVLPVAGATSYVWTVPTGTTGMTILSGQGNTLINVSISGGTVTGNVTCTAINSCGNSSTSLFGVSKKPGIPGAINGPTSACGLTSAVYFISPVFGATSYTWTVPSGVSIANGVGTTQITVNFAATFISGNINVTAVNACGSVPGTSIFVTAHTPVMPLSMSGPLNVCGLTTATYSVPAVAGATGYVWTITGAGTIVGSNTSNVVSVLLNGTTGGTISCLATNACGSGPPRTVNLVVTAVQPGAISGPSNTCGLSTANYFVANVAGAVSYNWTLPAGMTLVSGNGTTSITVNINPFSTGPNTATGILKVSSTNACGNTSALRTKTITRCLGADAMSNNREGANVFDNTYSDLYPNPAKSEFTIDISSEIDMVVVMEVYNVLGNKVISEKHNLSAGNTSVKTSIERYERGIYFVRMLDANGNVLNTQRVIKQ